MSENQDSAAADDLQFRRAEPVAEPDPTTRCVSCPAEITDEYFHAQGQVVCPECATKIEAGQQAPPAISLGTAALYGAGAAVAGMILYALVAIVTSLEIGLISILVGIMVGKAVRKGSKGLGGRPQQILAVALTYFSISVSNVPVFFWHMSKQKPPVEAKGEAGKAQSTEQQEDGKPSELGLGGALVIIVAFGLASPFLIAFSDPGSGLLSLLILFFGLQRAWALTGRSEILVLGPYKLEPVS